MTWSTQPNRDPCWPAGYVDSRYGMTAWIKGDWRITSAEFVLDPTAVTGHHRDDVYSTKFAFIGLGSATINVQTAIPT